MRTGRSVRGRPVLSGFAPPCHVTSEGGTASQSSTAEGTVACQICSDQREDRDEESPRSSSCSSRIVSAACSVASMPSAARASRRPPAPTSTTLATNAASAPAATLGADTRPKPEAAFRALDLPVAYNRGSAEAVDGTTAVGWVQVGTIDEQPAIWDTTTGALRVLAVPATFVHPSGNTFVRLEGVSGTTAVGTGILGTGESAAKIVRWPGTPRPATSGIPHIPARLHASR